VKGGECSGKSGRDDITTEALTKGEIMKTTKKAQSTGLTRRDALKLSGVALGGIALGTGVPSAEAGAPQAGAGGNLPGGGLSDKNSYFTSLKPYLPGTEDLAPDEMRITFLGTSPVPRLSQECNSIFVEVGSGDQFIFDCGSGVIAKYNAMGIRMSQMNKIFLTHLHGDHMSDLTHIYCFGQSQDRKFPLYVWGPSNSGFTYTDPDGKVRGPYEDGLNAYCEKFREVMRWHTESFSFGASSFFSPAYPSPDQIKAAWGLPPTTTAAPVGSDPWNDAYALVPIELDWTKRGDTFGDNVAYNNAATGVKITHFPVIHCRRGSIGYKLEWNGLSMLFTGDTKPNYNVINHGKGVDVLIHEMVVPADVWAAKNSGLQPGQAGWDQAYNYAKSVQDSSHTPQGAFGYVMSQIDPPPRLVVATHFQATDDTIRSARQSVENHYRGDLAFALDLMVFNVTKTHIQQRRGVVSGFAWYPVGLPNPNQNTPFYWTWSTDSSGTPVRVGDPYAQIDRTDAVPQKDANGNDNWSPDGY
jgi:ribonuclease Z